MFFVSLLPLFSGSESAMRLAEDGQKGSSGVDEDGVLHNSEGLEDDGVLGEDRDDGVEGKDDNLPAEVECRTDGLEIAKINPTKRGRKRTKEPFQLKPKVTLLKGWVVYTV